MKLIDIYKKTDKTYFSFELLPPLKGHSIEKIYNSIDPLIEFDPININVTYHQSEAVYVRNEEGHLERKTVRKRPGTVAISAAIKARYPGITVVPHLICGGLTKEETEDILIDLNFLGMQNILVLRGDPVKSEKYFIPVEGGHAHTSELVEQVENMNKGIYLHSSLKNVAPTNFSVGVAGYPEKHFEAPNMDTDIKHLKKKVEAGADYIVTQLFFDNAKFFDFVEKCRAAGIEVPIIPGIKPITTLRDLQLLPQVFHIDIPKNLVDEVEKCTTNKAAKQVGVEWAIQQSKELKSKGVPAIHYYTIGISDNIRKIAQAVF
jgi:methylenetetrahydrofolate reductase (NADPH)